MDREGEGFEKLAGIPGVGAIDASLIDTANLDRGGLVTARGTGDGLVLRLDARVDLSSLELALREFLESRRDFLAGNDVALEWVGVDLEQEDPELITKGLLAKAAETILSEEFNITVRSSEVWYSQLAAESSESAPLKTPPSALVADFNQSKSQSQKKGLSSSSRLQELDKRIRGGSDRTTTSSKSIASSKGARSPSLFDGIDVIEEQADRNIVNRSNSATNRQSKERLSAVDPTVWDDPDARIIYSTLRSGQKIETEHSLVIFGDVNSGAEVIAGGDIIVLGILRGVAHAGAYDETGGGRVILALHLAPMQLRIGSVISRGAPEHGNQAEVARVEGDLIVVEPYLAKNALAKRK